MGNELDIKSRFETRETVENFKDIHAKKEEGLDRFRRFDMDLSQINSISQEIFGFPLNKELVRRMGYKNLHWQAIVQRNMLPIIFAGYETIKERSIKDISNSLGLIVVERKLKKADNHYLANVESISYSGVVTDSIGLDRSLSVRYRNEGEMTMFDVSVSTVELSEVGDYKTQLSRRYSYLSNTRFSPGIFLYGENCAGSTTRAMAEKIEKKMNSNRALIVKPYLNEYFSDVDYIQSQGFTVSREQDRYTLYYQRENKSWNISIPAQV